MRQISDGRSNVYFRVLLQYPRPDVDSTLIKRSVKVVCSMGMFCTDCLSNGYVLYRFAHKLQE